MLASWNFFIDPSLTSSWALDRLTRLSGVFPVCVGAGDEALTSEEVCSGGLLILVIPSGMTKLSGVGDNPVLS